MLFQHKKFFLNIEQLINFRELTLKLLEKVNSGELTVNKKKKIPFANEKNFKRLFFYILPIFYCFIA